MPNLADLSTPVRHERSTEVLAGRLQDLMNSRFDLVAPQNVLRVLDGETASLHLPEPVLMESGVLDQHELVAHQLTRTALRHLCERFRFPLGVTDRLLQDEREAVAEIASDALSTLALHDPRQALYRFVKGDDGFALRAVLSDRYQLLDNELALQALLTGLQAHQLTLGDCEVDGDVSLDRLRLRVAVPAISLAVPDLLSGYKMPFSMRPTAGVHDPADPNETPPVIWAGLEIANSETGGGRFTIAPRAVIQICRNGLTRPIEFARTHLGATLDAGEVKWSSETISAAVTLISRQVEDVVASYLNVGYLETLADEMRAAKGVEVDPPTAIATVTKMVELTEAEARDVFACFARGGDLTVLGVANAVTAAAQLVPDGDRQAEMEQAFWKIVGAERQFVSA